MPISVHGVEVSKVAHLLTGHGYECSVLGNLKGGSGENHIFDFVGRKNGVRLAIMGFDSSEDDEIGMVKLRVKTLDSNPNFTIVLIQSKDSKLREMGEEFGYAIIDDSGAGTVYEKLEVILKSL